MSSQRPSIALIGLGNMGLPIGRRWLDAHLDIVGFDLNATARSAFKKLGGRTTTSAVQAVDGADVVVLLLPDSVIVDAVVEELLTSDALQVGATVIDMSSSEPHRTQRNAAALQSRGFQFIDAPVSGGVTGAVQGALTIMVGGRADAVEGQRELLSHLGRVVHVGDVGCGHAVKALNNMLSAVHLLATTEATLIGEQFGIQPETLLEVVNGSSGRSASSEVKWPKYILPETYNSGFSAALMLKDTRIATQLAASTGRPTRLGQITVDEWSKAVDGLPPNADHTEIARWLREGPTADSVDVEGTPGHLPRP